MPSSASSSAFSCNASLTPIVRNRAKSMTEQHCYIYMMGLMAGLLLESTLGGCSIVMALKGHTDPNLQTLQVGSTKKEVEDQLGQPKESYPTSYGARTDIYEYESNNEPSPARALSYLFLDLTTIGLAEIALTPAELMTGTTTRLPIYYGPDGLVAGINETAPEMPGTPPEPRPHVVNLRSVQVQFKDLSGQLSTDMKGHHISRLAILPLADAAQNRDTPLGNYLSEKVTYELYKTDSAIIVERPQLQRIMDEFALTMRGSFDDTSVKRIGRLLGVDAVIMGTYVELGTDTVEVNARIVAVETAEVIGVGTIQIPRASVAKLIQ